MDTDTYKPSPFLMLLARVEQLCNMLDSDLLNTAAPTDDIANLIRHTADRAKLAAIAARLAMIAPTYTAGDTRLAMYLADLTRKVSDYEPK